MIPSDESIVLALQEKRFREAERAAIQRVKQEPLNPQGWVFLAEALLQQGFIETAGKIFERASLLDPTATWVKPVHALLDKLEDSVPRFDIEELLTYESVTVSAVVVARGEAGLQHCVASLCEAVDHIIVVDVGMVVQEQSIIDAWRGEGWQYFDRSGVGDVGAVYNDVLQHVKTDWVLFVEGSELLFRDDSSVVRTVAALYDRVISPVVLRIGRQPIHSSGAGELTFEGDRMFPVGKGYRFWGSAYPRIGDELGPHIDGVSDKLHRSVRVRFSYFEDDVDEVDKVDRAKVKREHEEQLLLAAKTNLLKSKQLVGTYRGRAMVDHHIASGKADKLLTYIEDAFESE